MKTPLLFFLLSVSVQLFSQTLLPVERNVIHKTLPNGFQYSLVKNSKPKQQAEIRLYVKAGALDESENQRGLAHFVEHMAFNGIKHFKKNELTDYLESIGMVYGGDLNANTSYGRTVYMLSVPLKDDNLEKSLTIVRDWADGLNFDAMEYDKERNIILEERRLRDTVDKRISNKIQRVLYGNSLYIDRDPIGKIEVIEHSDVKTAKSFYDTWYRPESMHLVVVGDINTTKVAQEIEKNMASLKSKSHKKQVERIAKNFHKTQVLSVTDKELTVNSANILYVTDVQPMRTVKDKKEALRKKIMIMLINLRAKDQFLKHNPKAMSIHIFTEKIARNRLLYAFAATYKNGEGLEALEELYTFMSSFEKYGFSASNFELAKKLVLANVEKTHARLKDNQSKDIAGVLIETIENNATYIDYDYDYELTKRLIKEMTLEEVNETYSAIFQLQNRSILFKDISGKQFEKQKVMKVLKRAKENAKDLSTVEKVASHITDENLTVGKIISKKFNKSLDIYSYVLENNISVDFKPNNKNKNLLLLQAFSEGGYSILTGDTLRISKNTTDIVTQSAPGKWTDIELAKIMAGKQAEVTLSIERFGEKIAASCNTKDMETMFELLYARVTEPKVDGRVLENIKIILSNNITQLENNPQYRFLKDIVKIYYGDNPELKPISPEEIEKLDAKSILSLYKERFSDMNHFHFVISGDASAEEIEKLIAKYLTHLPTQKKVEKYADKPYVHPKGKVVIRKNYNTENKANVTMQYSSKLPYTIENNLRAMIASSILSIRLRGLIREEKSGVYNIDVNTVLTHELGDEAISSIYFLCDPKRKDELLAAIYPAIEKLTKEGVRDEELATLKKMIYLNYLKQIDQNAFWVDGIMSSYRFHTPLSNIIDFPQILDSITKEEIQKVAQALFNGDLLVTVLMPHAGKKR